MSDAMATQMTRKSLLLRSLVAASIVLTIVVNFLANLLPFFGRSTASVSDQFYTLVTPAGYVFAIWGVIYIGLLAYAWAQFQKPLASSTLPDKLALPMLIASAANMVWLVLWHATEIYWSVPVMLVLLGSLIAVFLGIKREGPAPQSSVERWGIRAPISLYLGWISVATIANISGALVGAKWDGLGIEPSIWSIAVLTVGAALGIIAMVRNRDYIYAGVFVWAFIGIYAASPSAAVGNAALALALALIVMVAIQAIAGRKRPQCSQA